MKDPKQAKVLLEASDRDLTALTGMADQAVIKASHREKERYSEA